VCRQTPGEQNERDDDESDERADEQTECEGQSVLTPSQVLDQFDGARIPWGLAADTTSDCNAG